MGKDLKGKELGEGLTQRKNGTYQARYIDRFGKRKCLYGRKLPELKKNLAVAIAGNVAYTSVKDDITLDNWFNRWIDVYKRKVYAPIRLGNTLIFTIKIYHLFLEIER